MNKCAFASNLRLFVLINVLIKRWLLAFVGGQ